MLPKTFVRTNGLLFAIRIVAGLLTIAFSFLVTPLIASAQSNATTHASVNLQHSPTGTAHLTYNASAKTLTVIIALIGLAPNSTHPTHIHLGTCAQQSPTIKYMLANNVANAGGQAKSTTTLKGITGGIPATGWSIDVHNGPNLQPAAQYTPIACGDIHAPNGATSVTSTLGATPFPNENATGSSQLNLTNGTMTVTVTARGLAPNSDHAAHIHAGNCQNTQQVLYDLSPLHADASGTATKTFTFNRVQAIPTSGWDINVHYTTDLSNQTGYNPILCGNIVVG